MAEIAAELKMNHQRIRKWIDNGYLLAIRIGRRVRIKRSDFEALLDASYTGEPQTPAGLWNGEVSAAVTPGENKERQPAGPASGSSIRRLRNENAQPTARRAAMTVFTNAELRDLIGGRQLGRVAQQ